MMEAVLTCSALTKAYGPNKALDNFTAVFSGGASRACRGRTGSGKTTLMKLAAGLLVPTAEAFAYADRRRGRRRKRAWRICRNARICPPVCACARRWSCSAILRLISAGKSGLDAGRI